MLLDLKPSFFISWKEFDGINSFPQSTYCRNIKIFFLFSKKHDRKVHNFLYTWHKRERNNCKRFLAFKVRRVHRHISFIVYAAMYVQRYIGALVQKWRLLCPTWNRTPISINPELLGWFYEEECKRGIWPMYLMQLHSQNFWLQTKTGIVKTLTVAACIMRSSLSPFFNPTTHGGGVVL